MKYFFGTEFLLGLFISFVIFILHPSCNFFFGKETAPNIKSGHEINKIELSFQTKYQTQDKGSYEWNITGWGDIDYLGKSLKIETCLHAGLL